MSRPNLREIRYWENQERRILAILTLALQKLANEAELPRHEDRLNRRLYFYILEAIRELTQRGLKFTAYPMYEANNQPDADDEERAAREGKRPDFQFGYVDQQEPDARRSAKQYVVECKRLGDSGTAWNLNSNYIERGVIRFRDEGHGYGMGGNTGAMIGYLENTTAEAVLEAVNPVAQDNDLPELTLSAAEGWLEGGVNRLEHQFERDVPPSPFALRHLWLDLTGNN